MNEITILQDSLEITTDNAADIFEKAQIVKQKIKEIEESVYKLVSFNKDNSIETPGIGFKYSSPRRSVSDTLKAFKSLEGAITHEEFIGICKVGLGDLEKLYKSILETTTKQASLGIDALLADAGCLETSQPKPSLTLIK